MLGCVSMRALVVSCLPRGAYVAEDDVGEPDEHQWQHEEP
jgi:hypothetical protein